MSIWNFFLPLAVMQTQNSKGHQIFRGGNSKFSPIRFCVLSPSRRVQNFRPICAEIAELNSFLEIAIAPRRNAMRTRYIYRPEKSTNGVGMVTLPQTLHDDAPMPGRHCSTVSGGALAISHSPRLHRDSTFVRPPAINWQCRYISGSHTADGRLLSLTRRRGIHCQNAYVTPLLVFLLLAVLS